MLVLGENKKWRKCMNATSLEILKGLISNEFPVEMSFGVHTPMPRKIVNEDPMPPWAMKHSVMLRRHQEFFIFDRDVCADSLLGAIVGYYPDFYFAAFPADTFDAGRVQRVYIYTENNSYLNEYKREVLDRARWRK
jgi:hypothetical protein